MSRELPNEAFSFELALEARVNQLVNARLNKVLSLSVMKLRHESKMSVRKADQKSFERAAEVVETVLDEVNRKGMFE